MMIKDVSEGTYEYLEQCFERYSEIDNIIVSRKHELSMKKNHGDENIGGGRANFISRPTENLAIKIAEDKVINYYSDLKHQCDEAISKMTDDQLEIYDYRFKQGYSWEFIQEMNGYTKPHMMLKRKYLLQRLAREMGLI